MNIRHLLPNEDWPANVPIGVPAASLDHRWCWVAEDSTGPQGGLLACPMHHAIFLLRVVVAARAPKITLLALLRGSLREAKGAGYNGFITMIEPGKRCGERLAKLATRIGGLRTTDNFNLVCGSLERL